MPRTLRKRKKERKKEIETGAKEHMITETLLSVLRYHGRKTESKECAEESMLVYKESWIGGREEEVDYWSSPGTKRSVSIRGYFRNPQSLNDR